MNKSPDKTKLILLRELYTAMYQPLMESVLELIDSCVVEMRVNGSFDPPIARGQYIQLGDGTSFIYLFDKGDHHSRQYMFFDSEIDSVTLSTDGVDSIVDGVILWVLEAPHKREIVE